MPAGLEMARGDETVATVVAGPAEHSDGPRGIAPMHLLGHGASGILHELLPGDAATDGGFVGAAHLRDGQDIPRVAFAHANLIQARATAG